MYIKTASNLTCAVINIIKSYLVENNWFYRAKLEYMYQYNILKNFKGKDMNYKQIYFSPIFNLVSRYINIVKIISKRIIKDANNPIRDRLHDSIYFILRSTDAIQCLLKYYDLHTLIYKIIYQLKTNVDSYNWKYYMFRLIMYKNDNNSDINVHELLSLDQVRLDIKCNNIVLYNMLYPNDSSKTVVHSNFSNFSKYDNLDCDNIDILYFNL